MKSAISFLFLFTICLLTSCSSDDADIQEIEDLVGPEFKRVIWISNNSIENQPEGYIVNESNYTISIESGFHLLIDVIDDNIIEEGDVYFTVNNDPDIKEVVFSPSLIIDNNESGVGYVYRVGKVWLGPDEWYILKPGDTYQFYAKFTDEFGNESSMTWTADLIE